VFSFPDWSTGQDEKDLERLEKRRAAQRRYRESHKEQISSANRRYRETHKEQISEYARRKWRTDPDHREKHRVRNRQAQRRMVFRKVYGISWADYEAMFERQGGACAICKRTGVTLCVDHCHLTGEVRGLLCIRCNSAIGFCSDDPAVLQAAAAYLQAARDRKKAQSSRCTVPGACSSEEGAGSPKGTCTTRESMTPIPIPPERDAR
jgi:Recombination endonuclease VII